MQENLKQCICCMEYVHAGAHRCKHCLYPINKNIFNRKHPMFWQSIPMIVLLAGVILIFAYPAVTGRDLFDGYGTSFVYNRSKNDFMFSNDKVVSKNPNAEIIGEIKNNGKYYWYTVHLKAKLLNAQGEVLDVLSDDIRQLRPGETKYFKFNHCCGEKKEPIHFDKYELIVEDAILSRW